MTAALEEWKPIPGYEGLYAISNLGRIKSLARLSTGARKWRVKERILKPGRAIDGKHYATVLLSKDGSQQSFAIHRVVSDVFVGPCPDGMDVCHNDGDKYNNASANLRHDTRKGNLADKPRHGTDNRGDRHPMAKLSGEDVTRIRECLKSNQRQRDIAEAFGVTQALVSCIKLGKLWSHT